MITHLRDLDNQDLDAPTIKDDTDSSRNSIETQQAHHIQQVQLSNQILLTQQVKLYQLKWSSTIKLR